MGVRFDRNETSPYGRIPPRRVSVKRDRRLREIERRLWRAFAVVAVSMTFWTWVLWLMSR